MPKKSCFCPMMYRTGTVHLIMSFITWPSFRAGSGMICGNLDPDPDLIFPDLQHCNIDRGGFCGVLRWSTD
jgi:hypothetical protein